MVIGNNSKESFPLIEFFGVILFFIFISIYFSIQYFNIKKLKLKGEIKQAVVYYESVGLYTRYGFSYGFCEEENLYGGLIKQDEIRFKRFIYGDKITIKYLPTNPKINKPMYLLYKKDPEIRKQYEKEFLKKLNKEEPVNEYWRGWDDVLNYQQKFPVHSEYPCLPPWY